MKRSNVMGIIFLMASKLSFAMNLMSGVYVCTNEDQTIVAITSFLNSETEVKIAGPNFLLVPEAKYIRIIETKIKDILAAIQVNSSLEAETQFAQLSIYRKESKLYGRLLVGDERSFIKHQLSCRFTPDS